MGKMVGLASLAAVMLLLVSGPAGAQKAFKDAATQVGDIRMHYLEAGSGDNNLVFVPGLTMTAEVWQEQLPYFAARGFHVFAIDPRSHGATSKTDGGNTYHQQAADLHAFLQKMKLDHCTLIGWSAGVAVLLEYYSGAESYKPDRLVLVDGAPAGLSDKDYPGGLTLQQAREAALAMQDDRPKAAEAMVRSMFKSSQPGSLIKELIAGTLKTATGTTVALLFDLITGDRRPVLAQIDVPTLIVVPQERQLLGEYMQGKIAGSQLKVIPDVGHALFLEKPQAFNQALEDFLGNK
jgi:pimeloyl-ACP methyl ester carboxylesterase